jgi:predicted heme/steroid binding protein
MKKYVNVILVTSIVVLLLTGCQSEVPMATTEAVATESEMTEPVTMIELSLDELKIYDGKNNQPAYVAFEGMIYDVTNHPKWPNGEHNNGLVSAGTDITEAIKSAPHGNSKIKTLKQVGTLK